MTRGYISEWYSCTCYLIFLQSPLTYQFETADLRQRILVSVSPGLPHRREKFLSLWVLMKLNRSISCLMIRSQNQDFISWVCGRASTVSGIGQILVWWVCTCCHARWLAHRNSPLARGHFGRFKMDYMYEAEVASSATAESRFTCSKGVQPSCVCLGGPPTSSSTKNLSKM